MTSGASNAIIGVGSIILFCSRIASRGKGSVLSGADRSDITRKISLFQKAIDRGDCRAADGLIERMGEERAVRMLRSMIQQFRGSCQGK
jgi:hypothetical protein